MTVEDFLRRLDGTTRSGDGWTARCPAHDDENPSLSVAEGDDGRVLVRCHAGCRPEAVVSALGLSMADLFPTVNGGLPRALERRLVETYPSTDETNTVLFEVCRYRIQDGSKTFKQRRTDGRGGWVWSVRSVRRVPYRLPAVIDAIRASDTVFVVEGEKDADRLAALGLCGTTGAGGAGAWRGEYAEQFDGAQIAILPDNDTPGRDGSARP